VPSEVSAEAPTGLAALLDPLHLRADRAQAQIRIGHADRQLRDHARHLVAQRSLLIRRAHGHGD
jgi:hypothetical protein